MKHETKTCAMCGEDFVAWVPHQRYCSPTCERPCGTCGELFTPGPKAKKSQRYCSVTCANRIEKRRNPRRGEDNYAWKGDDARPETKRERARAIYPLDGVVCEHKGCDDPATDRHHINGDTGDNRRENLQFLCRRHHMEIDGRLEAFIAAGGGGGPR